MKTIDLLLATRHNNIGHIHYKLHHVEQALHYFQKALNYTNSLPPNIPLLSKIFCNFGVTYEQAEDHSKAELYWQKCLENHLISMANNTDATAYLFQAVALNLIDHKKYDTSIELLRRSLIVCKNQGQKALCCCQKILATAYHALGNFQLAIDFMQKAIDIAHTLTDMDLGVMYVDLGNVFYIMQQYQEALVSYEKALEFTRLNAKLSIHVKIFLVYTNQNQSNHALRYYRHHLEAHIAELDSDDRILIHYYIGVNYDNLKHSNEALKYFKIDQDLMSSITKYKSFVVDTLKRMEDILINQEQWSEANSIYTKLLECQPTANVHLRIGIINIKRKNFQDAIQSLKMAQELATMMNDLSTLEIATRHLTLLSRTED
jgi:tetratricopeptide (TPR) repeat protein